MLIKENYYIITGGPGVGKTTLIDELRKNNYYCVREVAREIIKHQQEIDGDALPWGDTKKYSELMLKKSIKDFEKFKNDNKIIFFDRGIPDTYAYMQLINYPVNDKTKNQFLRYKYNKNVFILPPWEEIYCTDNERKQDFELAVKTYEMMKYTYTNFKYKIIEVPKLPVSERLEFILKHL